MKHAHSVLSVIAVSLTISCMSGLVFTKEVPPFEPAPGKSLVVVYRGSPQQGLIYNSDKLSTIYVDGVFCSCTRSNTATCFSLDPGIHYVFAKIDNVATARFDFAQGKIYYLLQETFPVPISAPTPGMGKPSGGLTRVNTTLTPLSDREASDVLQRLKGVISYCSKNPKIPQNNMSPHEVKQHSAAFETWAKENTDRAKKCIEYPGY